jgi:methionine synthase II (cobalamin-independent)
VTTNVAHVEDVTPSESADRTVFGEGALVGIGSLPHRDAAAAAAFAIGEFDIATIPTLPKRSPAENSIQRAIGGAPGVSFGQYGSIAVDPRHLGDDVPITTDLSSDAFVGLTAFLDLATRVGLDGAPVKWQFVGPVTLGVALQRAGLRHTSAFAIAARAVREHLVAIRTAVSTALPESPQLVMLDEPELVDLLADDFPIPPDEAVDLISTGMAAIGHDVTVGVHCCGSVDVAMMFATGPCVVSIAADERVTEYAGYIDRFLGDGGLIAWGVTPVEGPLPTSGDRPWRALSDLWCELVERGCDPVALRRQSLVTPVCGLASHSVSIARRIARTTGEVARRVKDQSHATRFAVGA